MLKLDYTSALFYFCIFHIHLFPFPNHLFLWLLPSLAWLQLVLLSPLSRDGGGGGEDGAGCGRGELGHVWKPTSDVLSVGFHLWLCMGCYLGMVPFEVSVQTRCSSFSGDCGAFRPTFTASDAALFLEESDP